MRKAFINNLLNSFSGEYRELFFEKGEKVTLNLLNGNIESPTIIEESGFSILSRSGENTYFKSIGGLDDIEKEVLSFRDTYNLSQNISEINLSGPDNLEFVEKKISDDILKFAEILLSLKEIISEYRFITSYNVVLGLALKSFIVANSSGNLTQDSGYYNTFYIVLNGEKDGNSEEIMEKITGTDIVDNLTGELLKETLKKAILKLEKSLNGVKSPSGLMDVIIGNEAGGTIIHEAVGHGLEADLLNSSVYKGKLGQKVAASIVNVVDNPTICNLRGNYNFDHEGNIAKKTYLIKDGILVSYLHNTKTGEVFGVDSTGHGRRESYKYTTLVRMGSTYLEGGKDKKEDLIKKVKDGIYVSSMGGGQVNTVTGDFVFQVGLGYRIIDGKIGEVIRGANISGNGPEMLQNIEGICDDLEYFDGGTCGKGQQMPVSDATPTILVKLKVTPK
ncbi:TldD/PmbA family protein [Candidatus Gracilibacteria bacterium]|nr:TldD/PmbA family protein [Candidatus Gracilibacteria bacterium]